MGMWRPELPMVETLLPSMASQRDAMQLGKHIALVVKAATMNNEHLKERPTAIPQLLPPERAPYPLKCCLDAWDERDSLLESWHKGPPEPVFFRKLVAIMVFSRANGVKMPREWNVRPPPTPLSLPRPRCRTQT